MSRHGGIEGITFDKSHSISVFDEVIVISSKSIGEMVMEALKDTDEVAYVRYASVYRSFKDISSFMSELEQMIKK